MAASTKRSAPQADAPRCRSMAASPPSPMSRSSCSAKNPMPNSWATSTRSNSTTTIKATRRCSGCVPPACRSSPFSSRGVRCGSTRRSTPPTPLSRPSCRVAKAAAWPICCSRGPTGRSPTTFAGNCRSVGPTDRCRRSSRRHAIPARCSRSATVCALPTTMSCDRCAKLPRSAKSSVPGSWYLAGRAFPPAGSCRWSTRGRRRCRSAAMPARANRARWCCAESIATGKRMQDSRHGVMGPQHESR